MPNKEGNKDLIKAGAIAAGTLGAGIVALEGLRRIKNCRSSKKHLAGTPSHQREAGSRAADGVDEAEMTPELSILSVDQIEQRALEEVRNFGLEPNPDFRSPFGDDDKYSPKRIKEQAQQILTPELDEEKRIELQDNTREALTIGHIRGCGIEVLEKWLRLNGFPKLLELEGETPEFLASERLKNLSNAGLEDAREFLKSSLEQFTSEVQDIEGYASRVKEFCDKVSGLNEEVDKFDSFEDITEAEVAIRTIQVSREDKLEKVRANLANAATIVASGLVTGETEGVVGTGLAGGAEAEVIDDGTEEDGFDESLSPEFRKRGRLERIASAPASRLGLLFGVLGGAVAGGAIDHVIFDHDHGDQATNNISIKSFNNSFNNSEINLQGLLGSILGKPATATATPAPSETPTPAPSETTAATISPLERAKDALDMKDGVKDGLFRVVISKAQGSGGIDTVEWALDRTVFGSKHFIPANPSVDAVDRDEFATDVFRAQGKTYENYHWVDDGEELGFKIDDQTAQDYIDNGGDLSASAVSPDSNSGTTNPSGQLGLAETPPPPAATVAATQEVTPPEPIVTQEAATAVPQVATVTSEAATATASLTQEPTGTPIPTVGANRSTQRENSSDSKTGGKLAAGEATFRMASAGVSTSDGDIPNPTPSVETPVPTEAPERSTPTKAPHTATFVPGETKTPQPTPNPSFTPYSPTSTPGEVTPTATEAPEQPTPTKSPHTATPETPKRHRTSKPSPTETETTTPTATATNTASPVPTATATEIPVQALPHTGNYGSPFSRPDWQQVAGIAGFLGAIATLMGINLRRRRGILVDEEEEYDPLKILIGKNLKRKGGE